MRSTDDLNLVPKHIVSSLSESPCLIKDYMYIFKLMLHLYLTRYEKNNAINGWCEWCPETAYCSFPGIKYNHILDQI